jgi:hypothetical protein
MRYQSLDNLSVVLIAFSNFKNGVKKAFEAKRNIGNTSQVERSTAGFNTNKQNFLNAN